MDTQAPFSTSDLLNWDNSNPSYRDDLAKVTDLIVSIFATHNPDRADIQARLNIVLTGGEPRGGPHTADPAQAVLQGWGTASA